MKMHDSITLERLCEAVERSMMDLDNPGFCVACGFEEDGCEPDARRLKCQACGRHAVYGAEDLLLRCTA